MATRSTTSCSGGSAWNAADLGRRDDHVHEAGLRQRPAREQVGLAGRHLAPELVGRLDGDDLQPPLERLADEPGGLRAHLGGGHPDQGRAVRTATASAGIQPSTCTFTRSPERATTRAGVPAWRVPSVPPAGVAPRAVSRAVWTRSGPPAGCAGPGAAAAAPAAMAPGVRPGARRRWLLAAVAGCCGPRRVRSACLRNPPVPPDPGPLPLLPDPLEQGALAHPAEQRAVGRCGGGSRLHPWSRRGRTRRAVSARWSWCRSSPRPWPRSSCHGSGRPRPAPRPGGSRAGRRRAPCAGWRARSSAVSSWAATAGRERRGMRRSRRLVGEAGPD